MEAQIGDMNCKSVLRYLVFSPDLFLITTFLNFLDAEHLQAISKLALDTKRSQTFYRIAIAKHFIQAYLNRVDRSIFFLFYQEPQFQQIENRTINAIAQNHHQFLAKALLSFQQIKQELSERTSFLEGKQQLQHLVQGLFLQPDMPMPQMKRETIGMFCQTPFQHFLSLKRFQEEGLNMNQWLDECLQELKEKLEHEVAVGVHSKVSNLYKLMETVRFRGWMVNSLTYKDYLVKDFHTHNMIVLLIALSSQVVDTYEAFLSNIKDPFMRFVQFNLRSTIYRNIVLAIEERLSFIFMSYDTIYGHLFEPPPIIPKFNFWRCAFSIWAQKMSHYHEKNNLIYQYITAKLRENSLLRYLSTKIERLYSVYSELRDEAELSGFSEVLKDQAYSETKGGLELESFFQNNEEIYQVLAKDYLEYSVDMSINEINVHWCGHSEHVIGYFPTYQQVATPFMSSSKQYYGNLKQKVDKAIPSDLKVLTFRELVKEDIRFVGEFIAKPFTVRDLVDLANLAIKQFANLVAKENLSCEEMPIKHLISKEFDEKDNLLSYFSAKQEIDRNCPKSLQFFYNIQTDTQAELPKITVEIESQNSENEHEIYVSDSEEI